MKFGKELVIKFISQLAARQELESDSVNWVVWAQWPVQIKRYLRIYF